MEWESKFVMSLLVSPIDHRLNPHRARKKMNYFERGRSAFASLSERAAVWAYLRRLISMVRLCIGVYCHITLAAEELFFAPAVIISN